MNRNNPLSIQRNEATIKKKIIKAQKQGVKKHLLGTCCVQNTYHSPEEKTSEKLTCSKFYNY